MKKVIINLNNVTYVHRGISYLNQLNLRIYESEVVGFIHIDHVGKRQLVEVLEQNVPIHYGKITIDDMVVNTHFNSNSGFNKSVYIIDSHNKFIQELTVIDNFFVLNNVKSDFVIHENKYEEILKTVLSDLAIDIKGNELVQDLSLGQQKILEIIKAVYYGAKFIVVLDISDFLSVEEMKEIHDIMDTFKVSGVSFGYFCNHHEEQFAISDRIFLVENGTIQKILYPDEYSDDKMLNYSFDFQEMVKDFKTPVLNELIEIKNLSTEGLSELSLSVRKGECVTILNKSNKSFDALLGIFSGQDKNYSGSIKINNVDLEAARNDISFVPFNPIDNFLFFDFSIHDNLMLEINKKYPSKLLNRKVREKVKEKVSSIFGKRDLNQDLFNLDVYTLYKIVYSKILVFNPEVVVLVQPFSNANMYLRQDIITLIQRLLDSGITVIILAVSLSDAKYLSNRIIYVDNLEL